jgi:hypothetical protein
MGKCKDDMRQGTCKERDYKSKNICNFPLYVTKVPKRGKVAAADEEMYRGPGFFAVVWFGSSPAPSPPLPPVSSTSDTQED